MTANDKLADEIERLAVLSEKATQGEWRAEGDGHVYAGEGWLYDTKYGDGPGSITNADFTSALVNWFRANLAALRAERPQSDEMMDAKRAKAILGDALQEDGSIYSLGHYMSWNVGDKDICLDDTFTVKELQAIVFIMLAAVEAEEGK